MSQGPVPNCSACLIVKNLIEALKNYKKKEHLKAPKITIPPSLTSQKIEMN
jgi:hypothetical protein